MTTPLPAHRPTPITPTDTILAIRVLIKCPTCNGQANTTDQWQTCPNCRGRGYLDRIAPTRPDPKLMQLPPNDPTITDHTQRQQYINQLNTTRTNLQTAIDTWATLTTAQRFTTMQTLLTYTLRLTDMILLNLRQIGLR